MNRWIVQGEPAEGFPTIHVLSDSLGQTAQAAVRAASSCFGNSDPAMMIWSEIESADALAEELPARKAAQLEKTPGMPFVMFYTVVDPAMRKVIKEFVMDDSSITAVDLMEDSISALSAATGMHPQARPGAMRAVNDHYFKRIDAIEFTIAHDDGRNPQDLTDADMVLIGVSRSSKTPLSIYLSQMGYKVANIPLDPLTEPPKEVFDVAPDRLFGLMTSPDVLVDIRKRRLGNAVGVASTYADKAHVYEDLEKSRALMRKLGCIVVRTDNRAIEETAQEILRYYSAAHPMADFGAR